MTYTRKQLEQMTDETLERKARQLIKYHDLMPIRYSKDANVLQTLVLIDNGEAYARSLDNVICGDDDWSEGLTYEGIATLLKAKPRQITIAAILTLQGEGTV